MNNENSTTENRFYDLQDSEALATVLQKIRRNVVRAVTVEDVRSAIARAERFCTDNDVFKNSREARDIHIRVNPARNRQPKARSYNGVAMAVEIILRWDTKKGDWYIDLDASGRHAALFDTRKNGWDSLVVVPDGNLDIERVLANAGVSLGDTQVKVGA